MSEDTLTLKPCPFCGHTPDEDSYYQNQGTKWGGIQCCIQGPDVRTQYKDWPAWKADAIAEWNNRASPWQDIETAPKDGTKVVLGKKQIDGYIEAMAPCSWDGAKISETGPFWIWWVYGPEWLLEVEDPDVWMPIPGGS